MCVTKLYSVSHFTAIPAEPQQESNLLIYCLAETAHELAFQHLFSLNKSLTLGRIDIGGVHFNVSTPFLS